jgi:hypothetical protein|tara:strand:+ start:37245 stop:37412 length:168 start_codon:yes stop_codon:yes gene_type:complete
VLGSKAKATFTSQSGKQEVLAMKGNWLDTTADITDEAQGGKFDIQASSIPSLTHN